MKEFYVIPTIGTFKVTLSDVASYFDKTRIDHYILNIGGNFDKCVNITIHPEKSQREKEIILSWAEVIDKSCTVNSQIIKGDATVTMINLAFTIAKEIAPYIEYCTLKDMSYFFCDTPDGKKKVSLPPYHIAFYDKTWYEDKFGAIMVNDVNYKLYKECINAMHKSTKPDYFNFGNDTIKDILYPLYIESKTWKEFFNLIGEKYPKDKCILMYPWIDSAISTIFKENGGSDLYTGKDWKISLNAIRKVHYYEIDKGYIKGGGYNENEYMNQYDTYRNIDYNTTMNWNIKKIITRRKTSKGYNKNIFKGTRKVNNR
jgi:hypothetical protein